MKFSERAAALSAKNILLRSRTIASTDILQAEKNITLIAEDKIYLVLSRLQTLGSISLIALGHIDAWQSEIKGQDVTVVSRSGDVRFHTSDAPRYFYPESVRAVTTLESSGDLTVSAGRDIFLRNIYMSPQSRSISLSANRNIGIENSSELLSSQNVFEKIW